jgi:hypothetical protein
MQQTPSTTTITKRSIWCSQDATDYQHGNRPAAEQQFPPEELLHAATSIAWSSPHRQGDDSVSAAFGFLSSRSLAKIVIDCVIATKGNCSLLRRVNELRHQKTLS